MTGILEQIHADLQVIKGLLSNGSTTQPQVQQPVVTQQPAAEPDPFGRAAAPAVTEAQVMALIEPHLDNQAIKTALQGVLAQMQIARLPDARPDQYAELYQRFTGVISQFQAPAQPQGII